MTGVQTCALPISTPQDTFNPEVMAPGNSGIKLQLALTPNQIVQDNTVKNSAEGLKDAIWLVWRTLVAHSEDYGVKKLAQEFAQDGKPVFLDAESFENMNYNERKTIHVDLALGMKSEENSLQRLQIIKQAQTGLIQEVMASVQQQIITPELFKKMRKTYEDTLYVLGVKDADTYLVTADEVMALVQKQQQAQQAAAKAAQENPPADDVKKKAGAQLDMARAQEIIADMNGNDAKRQLEGVALLGQHKARAF